MYFLLLHLSVKCIVGIFQEKNESTGRVFFLPLRMVFIDLVLIGATFCPTVSLEVCFAMALKMDCPHRVTASVLCHRKDRQWRQGGELLIDEDLSPPPLFSSSSSCPIFRMIHTQRALKEFHSPLPPPLFTLPPLPHFD